MGLTGNRTQTHPRVRLECLSYYAASCTLRPLRFRHEPRCKALPTPRLLTPSPRRLRLQWVCTGGREVGAWARQAVRPGNHSARALPAAAAAAAAAAARRRARRPRPWPWAWPARSRRRTGPWISSSRPCPCSTAPPEPPPAPSPRATV